MAAKAKATATASAKPVAPKGMRVLEGGYGKTWDVETMPVLEGTIASPPKSVTLTKGKKVTERQCVEVRTAAGERYTLWESATLAALFERLNEKDATPVDVWIAFQGYGTAKKGQNPPKLFEVAIKD